MVAALLAAPVFIAVIWRDAEEISHYQNALRALPAAPPPAANPISVNVIKACVIAKQRRWGVLPVGDKWIACDSSGHLPNELHDVPEEELRATDPLDAFIKANAAVKP
jgi:hypothetical protein